MPTARRQIVAWESRYFLPVGIASLLASALIIASYLVAGAISQNGHSSDLLVSAHEHEGSLIAYSVLQGIGFLLLMAPLYLLFRATLARNDRFRRQMVGVVVAAPIFFAIASIMTGLVTASAATKFAEKEATGTLTTKEAAKECRGDLGDEGKDDFAEKWDSGEREGDETALEACERTELEDDKAEKAISSQGLHGLNIGFELASRLGFAAILLYTCLMAMRVGLLTRFWGSLGMALGVASLILSPVFAVIFFIYFGLLSIGRLPGGRPPAWANGEAIPWPSPGEKAAAEMQPEDDSTEVVTPDELPPGEEGEGDGGGEPPTGGERDAPPPSRRKRKRRN